MNSLDKGGDKNPESLPGQRRETRDYHKGAQVSLWLRDHWVHIAFLGPPGHFRSVSYVDVLRGTIPKEAFAGKLVLTYWYKRVITGEWKNIGVAPKTGDWRSGKIPSAELAKTGTLSREELSRRLDAAKKRCVSLKSAAVAGGRRA